MNPDIPDILSLDTVKQLQSIKNERRSRENERIAKENEKISIEEKKRSRELDLEYCKNKIELFNKSLTNGYTSPTIKVPDSRFGAIDCILDKTRKAGYMHDRDIYEDKKEGHECYDEHCDRDGDHKTETIYTYKFYHKSEYRKTWFGNFKKF
jgi:hypothetical protein